MRTAPRLAAIAAAILIVLPAAALAQQPYYTGTISIDSVSAAIDVTDRADIGVEYALANHGSEAEEVTLAFYPEYAAAQLDGMALTNPVTFEAGAVHRLNLTYSLAQPGSACRTIFFSPVLLFDDMTGTERVPDYDIRLVLPEGGGRLIYSSMPYDDAATQGGRAVFIWTKEDIYPSPLTLSWTNLDLDITASKTASPAGITSAGELVVVEVTIGNQGGGQVGNITIVDGFNPGAFEAVAPLDEFELAQPELSDSHLYWRKEIAGLEPGEARSYEYTVKVKTLALETRLDPLVVMVDGSPVAVSNDVVLRSEFRERYGAESAEVAFPTVYLAVGVAGFAATTALVYALGTRRKRPRRRP